MREIKFRAWDKKEKTMHYLGNMNICFEYSHLEFRGDELDGICQWPTGDDTDIENQEIMQYTGLKDKKGNEIYEGDIVRTPLYGQKDCEIIFDKTTASFRLLWDTGIGTNIYPLGDVAMEIIGNIYENPELLK